MGGGGGGVEKWRIKLTSAKVEVEAELGKNQKLVFVKCLFYLKWIGHPTGPMSIGEMG